MKRWIGYYYTIGAYGDHLDAVKALGMNWAHVEIDNTHELDATTAIAARCQALGISVAYSISNILWIPGRPRYERHPDWKARFNYQRAWFDAFLSRGVLHSLYVADEPTGNGIRGEDLSEVCEFLRTETPYPTMIVEESRRQAKPLPPLDYYGLTHYTPLPFAEGYDVVMQDQRINVVVAQAFNENPHPIPDQRQWFKLWKRISHREGATLALFIYPSYLASDRSRSYVGAADVPSVLAEHANWANEINPPNIS